MQKTLLFIIFGLISVTVNAQFSVGVKQGYGVHGLYLEPPSIQKFQTSYWRSSTGLVFIYNNMENAGLQLEVNYAQKGWKEIDDAVPGSFFTKNINYIEIPVLSHFEIGHGAVRPTITAGPYIAVKLNEKADSANFSHIFDINSAYDHYNQEIKKIDFGIKVGVGLRYNINKNLAIYIEGKYDLDLAGGRDVFIDNPNAIQASRLKEISGVFGVIWHIIPQKVKENKGGYVPKESLFED